MVPSMTDIVPDSLHVCTKGSVASDFRSGIIFSNPKGPRSDLGTIEFIRADLDQAQLDAKDAEIARLREVAMQAISVIDAVQKYDQPIDPTCENALTMCEHEVFDFDVDAARAALKGGE